jgi:hypothetical protein
LSRKAPRKWKGKLEPDQPAKTGANGLQWADSYVIGHCSMSEQAIVASAEDEKDSGLLEILRAQPLSDESKVELVEAHPMVSYVNTFRADA